MRVSFRGMGLFLFVVMMTASGTIAARAERSSGGRQLDPKTFVKRVTIQASGGLVSTTAVLNALGKIEGYDAAAFTELLPSGSFRIDTRWTPVSVWGWNQVLPDGIRVEVTPGTKAVEPKLMILVDRAKLQSSRRRTHRQVRELVAWAGLGPKSQLSICDPALLTGLRGKRDLVVVLHGYQDKSTSATGLVGYLKTRGFAVATVDYPNDQPIIDSAKGISDGLKQLRSRFPGVRVRVVAHSMGGLVMRRMVEDPELDPGIVSQLIMVATPNQGSEIAVLGGSLEVWEHVCDAEESVGLKTLFNMVSDGANEASEDLRPGSIFLRKLNACKRNRKVLYSVIVGRAGVLEKNDLRTLQGLVATAKQNRIVRFFGPTLDRILAHPEALLRGKGDGAVSLTSGRLEGVKDEVVLAIDHCALFREPVTKAERQLRAEIVSRLRMSITK
ncbi:MAG: esterase/lipase family protein [Gemmataceae bacterium]